MMKRVKFLVILMMLGLFSGLSAQWDESYFGNGITLGSSLKFKSGSLRWTGTQFQVYTGAAWETVAVGSPGAITFVDVADSLITTIGGYTTRYAFLDSLLNHWTEIISKQDLLVNSAGLAAALSDPTGTGYSVFSISPTFTTSILLPKVQASSAAGLSLFEDGGNGIFVEDATADVGCGTITPAVDLHVSDSGSEDLWIGAGQTDTGTAGFLIDGQDGNFTGGDYVQVYQENGGAFRFNNLAAQPIYFRAGTNDKLFISGSSNLVGILTTSPDSTLTVDGSGHFTENLLVDGNVTIEGTTDFSGNYATALQNISDLGGSGASYYFQTDDYIEFADNDDHDFGTGDFSLLLRSFKPSSVSGTQYLINKEAGGIGYGLYLVDDDLYIRFDDNTTDASAIIGTAVFTIDVEHDICVTFDRDGNATAYINGKSVGTVDISSASLTLDNAGALRLGSTTAGANFLSGGLGDFIPFNLALSATKAIAYSNSDAVDYKYVGASQTDILSGWDFTSGWNGNGGATVDDTDSFTSVSIGNITKNSILTVGLAYNVSLAGTTTSTELQVGSGDEDDNTILTSPFDTFFTFTALNVNFRLRVGDSGTTDITKLELTRAGEVAKYTSNNATPSTWYDASGSNDGTVSGATLINANETGYFKQSVTIDENASIKRTFTAGATLAVGDLCYLDPTDWEMKLVDCDVRAKSVGRLAISLEVGADGSGSSFLLYGEYTTTSLDSADYWISATAGDWINTKPSTSNQIIRKIGTPLSATILLFDPDKTWSIIP